MQKLIETIDTYREGMSWFFDDKVRKIKHEQFVMGIPEMIIELSGQPRVTRAKLTFSASPFKDYQAVLKRKSLDNPGNHQAGGVFYSVRWNNKNLEGWLCPCFWKFFDTAPENLYVKVEAMEWIDRVNSKNGEIKTISKGGENGK
jgi:hypothetical protein